MSKRKKYSPEFKREAVEQTRPPRRELPPSGP
jgi:transposase-like protein